MLCRFLSRMIFFGKALHTLPDHALIARAARRAVRDRRRRPRG
jgi:hypothetical protein